MGRTRHLLARVPPGLHRCGEGGTAGRGAGQAPVAAADGVAGLRRRAGLLGSAARPGLRRRDPRLRHHRPLPDRPQARRPGRFRPPDRRSRPPWPAGRPGRGVQPRRPFVPGVPGGAARRPGLARRQVVPARPGQRGLRHVRRSPPARRPGSRGARGPQLRHAGHDPLAGPGRGRMAARRRVRRAGQLLGQGAAGGPRISPGRLVPRRDDPRRLRLLRGGKRPGLDHPVRAVEGHLELAERPELLRAGLGPRPARPRSSAHACRRRSPETTT